MLTLAFPAQPTKACEEVIYTRRDGSIDPPDSPISTLENTYTFTSDIGISIVVERNNIVFDGSDYALQGTGSGTGITLSGRTM